MKPQDSKYEANNGLLQSTGFRNPGFLTLPDGQRESGAHKDGGHIQLMGQDHEIPQNENT